MQKTLKSAVRFEGVGLHSGAPATLIVRPAAANHGIRFRRTDIRIGDAEIPAIWSAVNRTPLCTRLENRSGASVSTVEHLMAAFAGCGIHNALVEIDGPEVPILDGSSAPFVRAFLGCGLTVQAAPIRAIRILRPVEVRNGDAAARLEPSRVMEIAFGIDFADGAIGSQRKQLTMENGTFVRELCDCRTFCRQADVDAMRAQGLALGGVPGENAVVFDGDAVVSPGGLRRRDEPVRHKMLDALGDLLLAGGPVLGLYTGTRAGHSLTNTLLRAVFADSANYEIVDCDAATARCLPGAGVHLAEIPAVA
ncbi:putative UDP-3-O-acyl N-acetylglucosamine deacetylase [Pseudooceanicola batsensis HTCC2597]|uniref:UDP-3-O-acyl-N-acetylglucosamine deacetylase n=1 Tax=Pseudooceanicola batsensis (strain ATCC BAA-863 / DSM 15984 / KCTC 12145 / HTCC2597) TaxID=252305 RepID=A3TZC5_PSEBH|nr:UDP-3-O-acyl-N-acetylglucosamine deacetylase [Pseudooceanicola batsensis]EAQ02943.1 putative UDP-3-O-acyl N-acetylglucosamine deacetylase [Pseudooceanicola batsensis HTCC2597]